MVILPEIQNFFLASIKHIQLLREFLKGAHIFKEYFFLWKMYDLQKEISKYRGEFFFLLIGIDVMVYKT